MNLELNYWANIISVVSGVMTILGIGGIFTFSLFKKGETPFWNSVIRIFAYSIRLFFCVIFGLAMFGISYYPWYFLSDILGGNPDMSVGSIIIDIFHFGNTWATLIIGLVAIPILLIGWACLISWSLKPVKSLSGFFRNQS
jgi:hypothetical protein